MSQGKYMKKENENERLASTSWLAENLGNPLMRIVEVSDMKDPQLYFGGHIPGAVYWPWKESLWDGTIREFVFPKAFSELMEKSGIGHETTVVFYSNSLQFASYASWVCTMRGHNNWMILNGNRSLWEKENRPFTDEIPRLQPGHYPIRTSDESSRIGREGVLAGLNNPDRVLLDLRSPEEFYGERVIPQHFPVDHGAERKGHIPGAKHLFYSELLNEDETFKPPEKLREAFYKRGATPDKEIVFYCRLSHRGTCGWFAARFLLGYSLTKVYDGSWTEWGSIVGFPIVNESLANKRA
jgi:thiosulfate/3-mercaptopyruvate sulfurtransferase